jgi:methionyl-tRNA formyltransferase
MNTIVIASPHIRHNTIQEEIVEALPDFRVIRILEREALNSEHLLQLDPKWIFFPHWSWLIPKEVVSNFKCVIFHMTDLPYGRGGSPLQNLIVRGHRETQLSALQCVDEVDAGPVYAKRSLSLEGKAEEIFQRASILIKDLAIWIVRNDPIPIDQTGDIVQFKRRRPEDGDLSNLKTLEQVYDYIRMLDADGYPNAFIESQNLHFEFKDAEFNCEWIESKVRIRIKQ